MTAILMDALFHAWLVTADARIPPMIVRWCEFLDRKGFVPDGSRAYYVIDCFGDASVDEAPDAQAQGMERHSTELAMTFAMGHYFATDPALARRFRRRFDRLLAAALDDRREPAGARLQLGVPGLEPPGVVHDRAACPRKSVTDARVGPERALQISRFSCRNRICFRWAASQFTKVRGEPAMP